MKPLIATLLATMLIVGCASPAPGTSSSSFATQKQDAPDVITSAGFSTSQIAEIATIVDLDAYNGPDKSAFMKTIAQQFDQELLRKGYRVINRSVVDSAVKELGFQRTSGLVDPKTARELGKALGVGHILVASLTQMDTNMQRNESMGKRQMGIGDLINIASGNKATVTMNATLLVSQTFETLLTVTDSRSINISDMGQLKNAISQVSSRIAGRIPTKATPSAAGASPSN
jgi:hypothetical protein